MFRVLAFLVVVFALLPQNPASGVGLPTSGFADPKDEKAEPFACRSGEAKAALLKEFGGNDDSEKAVALGLKWLAKQQKKDGGWEYETGDKSERIAATGMALLAFLGAGETHTGKGEYAKTVRAGAGYLFKNCPTAGNNKGKMTANAYAQAIGTLALCELYGATKDKTYLTPAQAAVDYIVKAQAANGSWGYTPNANGDTSIVGWQIQALKAARLSKDIKVPDATFKKTVDFLDLAAAGKLKEFYGYNDNTGAAPATSLTAIGLLCRHNIDGWAADHDGMVAGVTGLMKRAPKAAATTPPMYFHYYASQVVRDSGGDHWKTWNEGAKADDGSRKGGMRGWLIDSQVKDGADEGSWKADPDWIGRSCGRLGTTAMCVLNLEVYYRYPPGAVVKLKVDPKK